MQLKFTNVKIIINKINLTETTDNFTILSILQFVRNITNIIKKFKIIKGDNKLEAIFFEIIFNNNSNKIKNSYNIIIEDILIFLLKFIFNKLIYF